MTLLGSEALIIKNGIAEGWEEQFVRWHTFEHIDERLAVPGFLRARRFRGSISSPNWLTLYETKEGALTSPAYKQRLEAPTEATREIISVFRNSERAICNVRRSSGSGVGGALLAVNCSYADSDKLCSYDTHIDVVATHVLDADAEASAVRSAEKALLQNPDRIPSTVLLFEGTSVESLKLLRDTLGCGELFQLEILKQRVVAC
ncbi:hypothetical protein EOA75_26215 [Mesorhizobium sp. M1A.F.Ca.IN.022.07.1.1]|uniref:hypothetical protein n=1 Tax=unclassified Mesorhizobium TaxID=325217 RepID=UPI000FCC264B|nr:MULTISPECIES: hypothetical protein [unclassified Mesorhizobium]RUV86626.1 hypothetical protein EOA75_26215 [Mesorhizobium sp. M1A.F.Ca.IN.022.07.1.1]RWM65129.1 MAG: hypothetical protein EOR82_31225 [Mesorhizobium sp.]RWM89592.1 MAG: hypothetical protein EOR86_29630 [Mesorhizobium sp.]TIS71301.1 MAG: hypothetical protein E5X11_01705 [Mesorhizobium sp.]TJV54603.1 MAG: hypothetical protein E5X82_30965 [Mesorhizobium sp.]